MSLKIGAIMFSLAAGALLSGCVAVPLNSSAGRQRVRAVNSRTAVSVHDRSQYRLQSISPSYVTVYKGDTVYSLSRKHNVPTRSLIEINRLQAPFILSPGQRLRLPPASIHIVRKGDTIYSISRRYNVDMSLLARQNQIKPPYNIYEGQFLKLPGSIVENRPVQEASLKTAGTSSQKAEKASSAGEKKTASVKQKKSTGKKESVRLPVPPTRAKAKFAWPVEGTVVTKFGSAGAGRHNDGINIKVNEGVSVRAAENGVVAYAGNELKGFGNLLLIKHADGWITAYAHNSQILAKRGETVSRGQPVAKAGKTGNAKEPQLHFEIRKGTKAVDPLAYMEKRR